VDDVVAVAQPVGHLGLAAGLGTPRTGSRPGRLRLEPGRRRRLGGAGRIAAETGALAEHGLDQARLRLKKVGSLSTVDLPGASGTLRPVTWLPISRKASLAR